MSEEQKIKREQRFEDLMSCALDGNAQADEVRALDDLLMESAANRKKLIESAAFECALADAAKGDLPQGTVYPVTEELVFMRLPKEEKGGRLWSSRSVQALIATAALVVVAIMLTRGLTSKQQGSGTQVASSLSGFAVVASQADVDWESPVVSSGDILPQGEHHIRSGVIRLELFSGVQLVVEGEAKFVIDSPLAVTLNQGAVRAYVPDVAHGFRVVTEAGKIIDYGTEFSVRVDGDTTDVTVLDGEVGVVQSERPEIRFARGDSLRVRNAVAKPEVLNTPVRVMSSTSVTQAARQSLAVQEEIWETALQEWLKDPRLVACYRGPTEQHGRVLENLVGEGASATQAIVVGATACVNRWGRDSQAFDYTRFGSRSRVAVQEEMDNISLVCWVKINSLNNLFNSLFLTDGHEEGEPHWQILKDGRIFFSVKHPHRKGTSWRQTVFYSPPIWRDTMSGGWNMLAVTYDRQAGEVAHYLNGKQISLEPIPEHARVSHININAASIANWAEPNPSYRTDEEFTCRNLNGAVDEVFIFDGALNADEISEIYSQSSGGE
ncbi:MAG: FecR domain-containing protein [Pirellulales bacterium]|nr:FecR domain-containing protein [Pirellulales bacterium]